ncbi:hypothetical protein TI05_03130 [Achromatium sp. WMS3]|nr:hypothetical protein TI05_03130 [Achromatium sp. WMS3]
MMHRIKLISLPPISLHVGWVEPKRNPSLLMRFVPQRILCIKLIGGKPDLYALVFGSRLPGAEKFQDWVFEDVLPTLRKTGQYSTPANKLTKAHT